MSCDDDIYTTAPTHWHNLSGCDSERLLDELENESSLDFTETSEIATPNYSKRSSCKFKFSPILILLVYYRIYAEDGAIPSKTPVVPGDPFLGRIKAISVPPPHTIKAVKRSIAKTENIEDRTNTSLFLSSYSESPMRDTDKFRIRNCIGLGSTPQQPLALVAKMSDFERSVLESGRRGGLTGAAEPGTSSTSPEIRHRASIQHSPTFLICTNISTIGGSVLSTLRRRLRNAIESSL